MSNINTCSTPILITGTGRSGTTILADIISSDKSLLRVEEPNFITDLIIPYYNGEINVNEFLNGINNEGWRGSMKICRTLSEEYPETFSNLGQMPIRQYLRNRFDEIVNLNLSEKDIFISLNTILEKIVNDTCYVASKNRWLIKQPSAILYWKQHFEFWPQMKIIFVGRNLYYIILSRLIRGYQNTFNDAFKVCKDRLYALLEAYCEKNERILLLNITDISQRKDSAYEQICNHCNLSFNDNVKNRFNILRTERLIKIGDPFSYFSLKQKDLIGSLRQEVNITLNYELI